MRLFPDLQPTTARVVVTAGSLIGATHSWLHQDQARLFRDRSRESFRRVFRQAVELDAQLVLSAGGLLADPQPSLDDLRFVAQTLREAGLQVAALSDHAASDGGSGLDFLADLDLLRIFGAHTDPIALDLNGVPLLIGARPHGVMDADSIAPTALRVRVSGAQGAPDPATDVVVLGGRREPGAWREGSSIMVRPGWAAPALRASEAAAAFGWLEVDANGVRLVDFAALGQPAGARVEVRLDELDVSNPAAALWQLVAPELTKSDLVTLTLRGPFDGDVWRRCGLLDLLRRAAVDGTLLDVDLAALGAPDGDGSPGRRPSLLVELRRAADGVSRGVVADDVTLVRAAQAEIAGALQRTAPLEPSL